MKVGEKKGNKEGFEEKFWIQFRRRCSRLLALQIDYSTLFLREATVLYSSTLFASLLMPSRRAYASANFQRRQVTTLSFLSSQSLASQPASNSARSSSRAYDQLSKYLRLETNLKDLSSLLFVSSLPTILLFLVKNVELSSGRRRRRSIERRS